VIVDIAPLALRRFRRLVRTVETMNGTTAATPNTHPATNPTIGISPSRITAARCVPRVLGFL